MPDITMCNGINFDTHTECPLRDTCYRFTAESDDLGQAYFVSAPYEDNGCEYYWKTEQSKKD